MGLRCWIQADESEIAEIISILDFGLAILDCESESLRGFQRLSSQHSLQDLQDLQELMLAFGNSPETLNCS